MKTRDWLEEGFEVLAVQSFIEQMILQSLGQGKLQIILESKKLHIYNENTNMACD